MTGLGQALVAVVDQLHDGVYIVDSHRRITYWSKGAETVLGYRADEVIGRCCSDGLILHVDAAGERVCGPKCPLGIAISTGTPQSGEYFALHRDGHRIPVRIRIAPLIDERGNSIGAVEAFSDNTAHHLDQARIAELERAAMVDHLTGLPNRRHLEARVEIALAEAARYGMMCGILLLDVDHFKTINDTHGHQAGDETLRTVARTLEASSRSGDMVGRWGGEEFMLVAMGVDIHRLARVAERFRVLVENSVCHYGGEELRVTMCIGAALVRPGDTADSLFVRADRALYRAKGGGRNRVVMDDVPLSAFPIPLEAVASASAEVAASDV